ncbi:GTPase-activating protein GCS1 [Aspergillus chevalieri]|uniref:Zn finger-containing GTPase-activating protein for ADP-ribosylation facto n=1 Tax=Aspergillus chevalieri TaxID=182096 RepID=A0A7R7VI96_ASPCH|nr:Zn finger-containing GTPase-activating protein for ADP-ribosylation facto [Aspergillus chevalieri]BCR84877.1 Zn finger-containing GTPase-activating protein for ADP-ribosylation facto [Aspergillus chevalieri]
MSRMWEVDPETRAKLLQISKTNGNDRCCDCNAPSPQWASPKFGIFICLNCAGTHRGLGVHISFVRSITMDAFKTGEIHRMEQGGNEPWKSFFDNHAITQSEGRTFEDSTIKERYEGEVGEEWKERLAAKVEGREYVPGQREVKKKETPAASQGPSSISNTGPRGSSPALSEGGGVGGGKKERNEAYFAKLGTANATRSESLPPSQGGKFTGFGGGLPPSSPAGSRSSFMGGAGGAPALDDFQKDPMGTLTKGFGWFTSAVGKSAKTVHDSYIQPTAKQLAESDFAAQARLQAVHLGQNIQVGARGAADQFNRFVEGQDEHTASLARRRGEPERKDFWDDFAALGAEGQGQHRRSASRPNAIGTAAMKPGATGAGTGTGATGSTGAAGSGSGSGATGTAKGQGQQHEEGWDEDW